MFFWVYSTHHPVPSRHNGPGVSLSLLSSPLAFRAEEEVEEGERDKVDKGKRWVGLGALLLFSTVDQRQLVVAPSPPTTSSFFVSSGNGGKGKRWVVLSPDLVVWMDAL